MKNIVFLLSLTLFSNCHAQRVSDQSFVAELKAKVTDKTYPKIDAILVKQGDELVMEEYFNSFRRDTRHDVRSSFKSVASILAGIAMDKKLISLSDTLGRFFPELKDEGKRRISVQNILEMRSGLACEEFYEIGPACEDEMFKTQDWIAHCLSADLIREPGVNWSYNSNEPMLMGEIIARASGMTVMEFARLHLFDPLEITDYKWTISPKGQGMTAGSFYMWPADMLKIIEMVGNKGSWKGNQIVSAGWIEKSTTCNIRIDQSFVRFARFPDAKYESARYGFFWYKEQVQYQNINTEVLFSSGNGGQYMMFIPQYDLKVVFTGSNYGNWRGKLPFEMLLKYVLPAFEK